MEPKSTIYPVLRRPFYQKINVIFITTLKNNKDLKQFNSMCSTGKANTIQCGKAAFT